MHVLVTGGTGFIGSHTVVELLAAGHKVHIIDNLSNSKSSVITRLEQITGQEIPWTQGRYPRPRVSRPVLNSKS